jgi:prefoldin subunit 2
MEQEVHKRY